MERLDFVLPDFVRMKWVSEGARDVWETRFERISRAWLEIEWRSTLTSLRRCCVTLVSPADLVGCAGRWAAAGLSLLPVDTQALSNYFGPSSAGSPSGAPFAYRTVVGLPLQVLEFKRALDAGDDETIGRLLGCPPCCRRLLRRAWVEQGLTDATWPMAAQTVPSPEDAVQIDVRGGAPVTNVLWRSIGIRAVPHLPCAFECRSSIDLGARLMEVGLQAGFGVEMSWLEEVLSWPVEWSALHGIAEIKTPILSITTRTDATPKKYVVRVLGEKYPDQGATGLAFPYRAPPSPLTRAALTRKTRDGLQEERDH
jgi:hypothetical protein